MCAAAASEQGAKVNGALRGGDKFDQRGRLDGRTEQDGEGGVRGREKLSSGDGSTDGSANRLHEAEQSGVGWIFAASG